jgi:hypothetical protein
VQNFPKCKFDHFFLIVLFSCVTGCLSTPKTAVFKNPNTLLEVQMNHWPDKHDLGIGNKLDRNQNIFHLKKMVSVSIPKTSNVKAGFELINGKVDGEQEIQIIRILSNKEKYQSVDTVIGSFLVAPKNSWIEFMKRNKPEKIFDGAFFEVPDAVVKWQGNLSWVSASVWVRSAGSDIEIWIVRSA